MTSPRRPHRPKIRFAIKRAVYERDNWTCQYCGVRIEPQTDSQRSGKHAPMGITGAGTYEFLELDHIVPYQYGGEGTVENLRCACSPCNRRKASSTVVTDWANRIDIAAKIIVDSAEKGIYDRATVQAAARALLGVRIRIDELGRVTIGDGSKGSKVVVA
ncbi:HNH endonuclease [Rhodococcus ruber]|uniref:HNH endonuclease n=1 Tax=Rhodococcus ruber TaxID=1830 RepID=UPI0022B5890C|nr:HNH endonuclease [Rhodococcus ruber]MCZ4506346.1 HNH endonuclease [Rhodococcus ruber]